jgi:RNA polymerase sigma-70 factor (ECF subfamily)
MALAQAGDHEAYRAVLDDVSAMLKGFLRRRLADPEEAADVLQDVLLALHRARHTYDPARPFEPWLFAIVHHTVIDHVRRRKRVARVEILPDDQLPEVAAPEAVGASDLLDDALARLPPAQREAFQMLQIEGLSVAAAAARAGTSPGALKVRAHRAYKAIRQLLVRS